jgi:hypothetical protein
MFVVYLMTLSITLASSAKMTEINDGEKTLNEEELYLI